MFSHSSCLIVPLLCKWQGSVIFRGNLISLELFLGIWKIRELTLTPTLSLLLWVHSAKKYDFSHLLTLNIIVFWQKLSNHKPHVVVLFLLKTNKLLYCRYPSSKTTKMHIIKKTRTVKIKSYEKMQLHILFSLPLLITVTSSTKYKSCGNFEIDFRTQFCSKFDLFYDLYSRVSFLKVQTGLTAAVSKKSNILELTLE